MLRDRRPARLTAYAQKSPKETAVFDPDVPAPARIYDVPVGGVDNFEPDRAQARRLIAIYPDLKVMAAENPPVPGTRGRLGGAARD
jgi:hypothetical protein